MQPVDFFSSRIDAMIKLSDPLAVLATHGHWDHIGCLAEMKQYTCAPLATLVMTAVITSLALMLIVVPVASLVNVPPVTCSIMGPA